MSQGTFFGADIEALCDLALAMARVAEHLEVVDLRTADGLAGLRWTGTDADTCRRDWDETHAVTLHLTAAQLREAAAEILAEADAQLTASESAGNGAPTAATGTTGTTSTATPSAGGPDGAAGTLRSWLERLGAELAQSAETTFETLEPYTDGVGRVTLAADALGLMGMRTRAFQALDALPGAGVWEAVSDFSVGAVTGDVLHGLGVLGTGMDAYSAYQGYRDGDLWQATDGTVSVGLAGLAYVAPNPYTLGAGVFWGLGTLGGELINEGMAGTDFEARFTERMDLAFELGGAWGMLNTPGALLVTSGESVAEAAQDTWTDATELWDSLTGGTPEADDGP